MARDFMTVFNNILAIAPEELANELSKRIGYWAPEILWYNLSVYVNKYVTPSSSDPQAIAIYAELCGLSLEEMKSKFESDGL